ncbi:MAG TPA: hypothetical protein VGE21_11040 [Flavobacteriales bacterium]
MRTVARVLSVLLHPVWMPTLLVVMIFSLDPYLALAYGNSIQVLVLYGMVLVMTALFPLMSTWMLQRSGVVGSLQLPLRRDRIPVMLVTLLYHGMAYWLLRRTIAHPPTLSLLFGSLLALALASLITLRWKISLHQLGFGGVVGALSALVLVDRLYVPALLATAFVAWGALGSARLLVGDHSPAQVHAGGALGAVVMFASVMFGWWI